MDWKDTLIHLFLYIDNLTHKRLWIHTQRFSNNNQPQFTDAEALTVYLFGLIQQQPTLNHIHQYALDHLHD